jgi:hypothetical protein
MGKIKKRCLNFAPKDRKCKKIREDYSIDEVRDFLTRFLNDEFKIAKVNRTSSKKKRKEKTKPYDGLNEIQSLILSAAIIGSRIMLKFCKGEKPHNIRVQIWKKGLEIVESFEKCGLLPEKKIIYFTRGDYIFRCRVYEADGLGEIILPERSFHLSWMPETVGDYDRPPLHHPPMPPLIPEAYELKKQAARMISEYKN